MGRRPARRYPGEDRLPRACQVVLGLVLAVGAFVPAGAAAAAVVSLIRREDVPPNLFVLVVAGPFAAWTALLAWRLLTGRERRGGGLVPPWMLYLTGGALSAWVAARKMVAPGLERLAEQAAEDAFDLARSRRRAKGRRS